MDDRWRSARRHRHQGSSTRPHQIRLDAAGCRGGTGRQVPASEGAGNSSGVQCHRHAYSVSRGIVPGCRLGRRDLFPSIANQRSILMSGAMTSTWNTSAQTAHRMSRQARRDTRPEVAIRSLLHRTGQRFRVSHPVPELPRCTIDIAFTRRRVAVFVDGCFWHSCPEHGTSPKTNASRWAAKLESNRARDRRVDSHLTERGWKVLRAWEHEDAATVCMQILCCLHEAGAANGV